MGAGGDPEATLNGRRNNTEMLRECNGVGHETFRHTAEFERGVGYYCGFCWHLLFVEASQAGPEHPYQINKSEVCEGCEGRANWNCAPVWLKRALCHAESEILIILDNTRPAISILCDNITMGQRCANYRGRNGSYRLGSSGASEDQPTPECRDVGETVVVGDVTAVVGISTGAVVAKGDKDV